jgi:hypothetical protein
MAFMRTILTLSLAAFALAVPVALPEPEPQGVRGPSKISLSLYAVFTSLIDIK